MVSDADRVSVMLYKSDQRQLDLAKLIPQGWLMHGAFKCKSQRLGQEGSARFVMEAAQYRMNMGSYCMADMKVVSEDAITAKDVLDSVMELSPTAFSVSVMEARMTEKSRRTKFEASLLDCKRELKTCRYEHQREVDKMKVAGVHLAREALEYPAHFMADALARIKGRLWSADARDVTTVSLEEYMTTPLHMTCSAVFSGDPALGKTPSLHGLCARLSQRYLDRPDPWFLAVP